MPSAFRLLNQGFILFYIIALVLRAFAHFAGFDLLELTIGSIAFLGLGFYAYNNLKIAHLKNQIVMVFVLIFASLFYNTFGSNHPSLPYFLVSIDISIQYIFLHILMKYNLHRRLNIKNDVWHIIGIIALSHICFAIFVDYLDFGLQILVLIKSIQLALIILFGFMRKGIHYYISLSIICLLLSTLLFGYSYFISSSPVLFTLNIVFYMLAYFLLIKGLIVMENKLSLQQQKEFQLARFS